ncbi:hypothetical protein BYT27DRAFT_7255707 [Phlegmacium glaucopus]|nr:hypothetical protein BYT27DRAFT_7255707 [Phlegmacium glaucopus]
MVPYTRQAIDCEIKTNYNAVVISVLLSKLLSVKRVMREVSYQDVKVPIWFSRGSCWHFGLKRFGKGMMSEAYRLDINTMAVIMDNYASQLAAKYGADIAHNILKGTPSKSVLGHNTTNASTPLDSPQHDIPMDPFKTKHMVTPRAFYILNAEDEQWLVRCSTIGISSPSPMDNLRSTQY